MLQIGLELSDALARAHHQQIIHRDIKPENVLLTDFGVARLRQAERVTQTGSAIGTLDYLAPEALNGEAITETADVGSLGVMLWELLSRQHPFRGRTPIESLTNILTREIDLRTLPTEAGRQNWPSLKTGSSMMAAA